jgi:hypothetical protein
MIFALIHGRLLGPTLSQNLEKWIPKIYEKINTIRTLILCAKSCPNDAKMYTENHEWFKIIQLGVFMEFMVLLA